MRRCRFERHRFRHESIPRLHAIDAEHRNYQAISGECRDRRFRVFERKRIIAIHRISWSGVHDRDFEPFDLLLRHVGRDILLRTYISSLPGIHRLIDFSPLNNCIKVSQSIVKVTASSSLV